MARRTPAPGLRRSEERRVVRLISSRLTFFNKRIIPVILFGVLSVSIINSLLTNPRGSVPSVLFPIGVMALCYLAMRSTFNLLDEVFDDGDALVLKNRGEEERIALSDIEKVSRSSLFNNPPRVILRLRRRTIFGDKVAFLAPPFMRSA